MTQGFITINFQNRSSHTRFLQLRKKSPIFPQLRTFFTGLPEHNYSETTMLITREIATTVWYTNDILKDGKQVWHHNNDNNAKDL